MKSPTGRKSRPAVALLTTTALAIGLTTIPSQTGWTHDPQTPPAGFTLDSSTATADVTLLTGDVVHVDSTAPGKSTVTVTPAVRPNGSVPSFRVFGVDEQINVFPSDVAALIGERIDPALFNVTSLIAQGFDDAHSQSLPLIAQYDSTGFDTFKTDTIAGTTQTARLESVDAVALTLDKADATTMGTSVFELADAGGTQALSGGPLSDVSKLWLDGRTQASLDRSTAQISAPAAWDAGFDGSGVSVAVLDTGIDPNHPDLSGSIDAAQNFTWDPDTSDRAGHGTHVASIVAGTGDASDGSRQGVAPGADLLIGKVLDGDGTGQVSWLIEGMEWAAAQDADVVNMSLGLFPGHFQAPMLTDAVDRLSASHGTLFVAAAGNFGCEACIGSPGDAQAALTVGAVDREDILADFSSRGPVYETFGLKPDVTAPGVGIAAARAEGTGGIGDPYIAYSGTSMASPHVAGAAALLAQARPELTGGELKAALMSSAIPSKDATLFQQGTGRIDVEQALAVSVLPSAGSLDFGFLSYPHEPAGVQKSIGYHNSSGESVTLDLSVQASMVDGGAADTLSVSPAQLVVPAGESAEAVVTLNSADTAQGVYSGALVAEFGDGSVVNTPIGFEVEGVRHELTIDAIARDGRPASMWGHTTESIVYNAETGEPMSQPCAGKPSCFRVPPGTYSVMAYIYTKPAWADSDGSPYSQTPLHPTMAGDPELVVDQDTTVTFDAREAVEVTVDTPKHDSKANVGGAFELAWSRTFPDGRRAFDFALNLPGSQLEERMFMLPTKEVSIGEFTASSRWRLEAPAISFKAKGSSKPELEPQYYRFDHFSDNSWQMPVLEGKTTLPVVDAGSGTVSDIENSDLDGALALIRRSDQISVAEQSNRAAEAGAELVAIYNDEPGHNDATGYTEPVKLVVPTARLTNEEGLSLLKALRKGKLKVTAEGTMRSPYLYDLYYVENGRIPDKMKYKANAADMAAVERDFYSQLTHDTFSEAAFPFQPNAELATGMMSPLIGAPRTRVDYYLATSDIKWQHSVSTPEAPYNYLWPQPPTGVLRLIGGLETYGSEGEYRQRWYRQPLAPAFDPGHPVTRQGDKLVIPRAGVVDDAGNFSLVPTDGIDAGIASLFQIWNGDELLGETSAIPTGYLTLPAEKDTYRFTYQVDNNSEWAQLSTSTRTEWTVESGQTSDDTAEPLPLMALDYDLRLDTDNSFKPRSLGFAQIDVDYPGGIDIRTRSMEFSVSYDDGQTWRRMLVLPTLEGGFLVLLLGKPPKDAGFMSFKVSATDVKGNGIDQEIIRAVALK